jgi:ubiquinone/menaquinone biosynthesis C-methylase UbiE
MIHQHIKRVATEVDENNYIVVLPEMVANENAAFQEEEIQNDEWMYRYYKSMFQFKLDNLCIQVPPGSKVLDVCCGRGYLGQFFMEKGCHVTFCDLSPFQLTELKNRLANSEYKYDVIEANVEALPFEDGKFDFVVGNSFLHHFQNVPKGLSEITRMIRSGGGTHLVP